MFNMGTQLHYIHVFLEELLFRPEGSLLHWLYQLRLLHQSESTLIRKVRKPDVHGYIMAKREDIFNNVCPPIGVQCNLDEEEVIMSLSHS